MPRGIRPTQDKVRKAVFDIIPDIAGLSFLELFAGSGAIGFEAISRGVSELTLVENKRECIMAIRQNIGSLGLGRCRLLESDADKGLETLGKQGKRFDIVFLDPPYYLGMAKKILQNIGAYDIVAHNGLVIVQHFKRDNLPESEGGLILCKQARYGDTLLSFYRQGGR